MMKPSPIRHFRGPHLHRRASARHLVLVYRSNDVQRVLGAKSEEDARGGALSVGFLKILPVFVLVLPGLIARSLYPDIRGDDAYRPWWSTPSARDDRRHGAALMAALMSSLSDHVQFRFDADYVRRLQEDDPAAPEARLVAVGGWRRS